jgi:hypothetical protein
LYTNDFSINILLFDVDKISVACTEKHIHTAICKLHNIINGYNIKMSSSDTKIRPLGGKYLIREKIVSGNKILEQVRNFNS